MYSETPPCLVGVEYNWHQQASVIILSDMYNVNNQYSSFGKSLAVHDIQAMYILNQFKTYHYSNQALKIVSGTETILI